MVSQSRQNVASVLDKLIQIRVRPALGVLLLEEGLRQSLAKSQ